MIIYKYTLPCNTETNSIFDLKIPYNSIVLDIQLQGDDFVLWALVDTDYTYRYINCCWLFTGQEHDMNYYYIKTFQRNGLVWHLFCEIDLLNKGKI